LDTTSATHSSRWDSHWNLQAGRFSLFGAAAFVVRRFVFQPAVAYYCDRFFAERGFYLEVGCGTAQSSALIPRKGRRLAGSDISAVALELARKSGHLDEFVRADAMLLPYGTNTLDGIWNLGVMEHFVPSEIAQCLKEFHRALKPGGAMILFWPTEHNSSRWILAPFEWLISLFRGRQYLFFPAEISRLRSKAEAKQYLNDTGFDPVRIDFSWRTGFIHMVIIARKAA